MPKKLPPIEIDPKRLEAAFTQVRVETAQYISGMLENLDDMPLPEGIDRAKFAALLQKELKRCQS